MILSGVLYFYNEIIIQKKLKISIVRRIVEERRKFQKNCRREEKISRIESKNCFVWIPIRRTIFDFRTVLVLAKKDKIPKK